MVDIEKIRADFPILEEKVYGKPLVYLDNGATAQKPRRVIEKIDYLHRRQNANIHRGTHYMSNQCTMQYEQARELVRGFIHASSAREIVFTSGATQAINLVAFSFGEKYIRQGDEIIVSEMEHHSNIVPWQMLCERKGAILKVLPFDDEGNLMLEKLDGLLSPETKLVAVTQASNVLGTCPDLEYIIAKAHANGSYVLVDGCQGIVHGGVDVRELDCDFYVFSGHKLYGPTGIGVLYAKERLLEEMPPYMGGGDMVTRVRFEQTTYAELPLKFEAGTSNYIGAIGLGEAIGYLNGLDRSALYTHEQSLLHHATEALLGIEGLRIYGNTADKYAIISFTVEGVHPYDLGMIVDKMGVAIRTGTHCTEPVMAHYGLTAMARASFAFYNTIEETRVLAEAVSKASSMLR